MYALFYYAGSLKKFELINVDVSTVTDIRFIFYRNDNLQKLVLSLSLPNLNQGIPAPGNSTRQCFLHEITDIPKTTTVSFSNYAPDRANLQVITLPAIAITDCYAAFRNCYALSYLDMSRCDLSNASRLTDAFYSCYSLTTVFLPKVPISISFSESSMLTDESLINIANALDSSAVGETLKLNATPKARCNAIVGTVADDDFSADTAGTITLADFITNTKGWTLA